MGTDGRFEPRIDPDTAARVHVAEVVDDVRDGLVKERAAGRWPTSATVNPRSYEAIVACKLREVRHGIAPTLLGLRLCESDLLRPGEVVFR